MDEPESLTEKVALMAITLKLDPNGLLDAPDTVFDYLWSYTFETLQQREREAIKAHFAEQHKRATGGR